MRSIKNILLKKTNLRNFFLILFLASCGLLYTISTSPEALMSIGNTTFGGSPPRFYSIHVANTAYTRASKLLMKDNKPTPWAYYQRGRIAFIKGNFDEALEFFDMELYHYPFHTKVYYMKGLTLGYMGREREGIKAFTWYTQNTNDSWASFNDLAWLQFRVGDIDEALKTIEPIARSQEYNPWTANTYAVLLMNKERYQEAKTSLQKGMIVLSTMTEEDWGKSYPGNDPRVYAEGLKSMKESYENNFNLIEEHLNNQKK